LELSARKQRMQERKVRSEFSVWKPCTCRSQIQEGMGGVVSQGVFLAVFRPLASETNRCSVLMGGV